MDNENVIMCVAYKWRNYKLISGDGSCGSCCFFNDEDMECPNLFEEHVCSLIEGKECHWEEVKKCERKLRQLNHRKPHG